MFGFLRFILLVLCFQFYSVSATTDSSIRYTNAIYEGDIRSVVFENKSTGFNLPIISLGGSSVSLKLSFDQSIAWLFQVVRHNHSMDSPPQNCLNMVFLMEVIAYLIGYRNRSGEHQGVHLPSNGFDLISVRNCQSP